MAVLTDDPPSNSLRSAAFVIFLGLDLGLTTSFIAYEFTYKGVGADLSDLQRAIATSLIVAGIIFAIALIYIGAATYWSERPSRREPPQYPSSP